MNWIFVGVAVGLALLVAFAIALRRWCTVEQGSMAERDVEAPAEQDSASPALAESEMTPIQEDQEAPK